MKLLGSNSTLSFDFGSDEIKIVEGKHSRKGVVINKNFSVPLPRDLYVDGEIQDMEQLAYLIRNGLSEQNISQSNVHGVINSTKVIMREISMPKVNENQIESILGYQLADYLPVDSEEYVVKHITLGEIIEDGIEKLNILLIGIPRTIVKSHYELFKNLNLRPSVLEYSGNSINKLIYSGDKINNIYENNTTIACINLEHENTGLTITHKGIVKVSRVSELGFKDIINDLKSSFEGFSDDDIIDKIDSIDINVEYSISSEEHLITESIKTNLRNILDRIEMIFRYYITREAGNDIGLILIYGGASNISGIEKLISTYLDKQCIRLDFLNKVKFNGDLSKYASAIGGLILVSEV